MAEDGKPVVDEEEEDLDALWGGTCMTCQQRPNEGLWLHRQLHTIAVFHRANGSMPTQSALPIAAPPAAADEPPRQGAAQPPAQAAEPSSSEGDSYFEGSDAERWAAWSSLPVCTCFVVMIVHLLSACLPAQA